MIDARRSASGRVPADARAEVVAVIESAHDDVHVTGDLFLFVSTDCKHAKVLYFDGTGLCLLSKSVEKGKFVALWKRKRQGAMALFIERSSSVGRLQLSPPLLAHADLRLKVSRDAE
jgi:transposase